MEISLAGIKESGSFTLPLANEKNRLLQLQINEKRRKLAKIVAEIDQNENHVKVAEQEISSLEQTNVQTNNLVHNIKCQSRKEAEAFKLALGESNALNNETKRVELMLEQISKQRVRLQKRLEDQRRDMKQLWEIFEEESKIAEAMERMVESQQEDRNTLEKYSHKDNLMIKDLEIKLARAKEEAAASERQLKGAKEDRENAGVQLQQMQEEFRSMMDDRNQSLQRWEQNLVQTSLCNQQLEISRKEYQETKELANSDQNRLDEVNRCVKQMNEDIVSLERTLYNRELVASQIKIKLDEMEKLNAQQEAEHSAMENVTKRLTAEIMASRTKVENCKQKLSGVQAKLLNEYEKYKQLEKELGNVKSTVCTAQTQKEQLEKLAKATDERLARQKTRLNHLANEHVRIETEMRATKNKLNCTETNMRININSLSNLEKNINNTKLQIKQQEELVYKKNIEILRVEQELRKMRSNAGEPEERIVLRHQIETTRSELDASNSYLIGLKYELSKTQSDMIGLQRGCDLQQQRKNVIQTLAVQLQSECQSREREYSDLQSNLEELRMKESLLQLEVKRRESTIQSRSSAVEQLENQKKQIELLIQTRREELKDTLEMLQLESRALKERTQQLFMEVNKKSAEVDRIKLRYELVATTLVTDSNPQLPSEAYYIIKIAQERELMKESIRDLESVVSNLENDNIALNNTIKLVSSSNQQFRQHTIVGIMTDDDKAQKLKMEQENQLLERTLTSMKKEAYQESHRIEVLREEVIRLKEEAYRVKFSVEEKEILSKDNVDEVEKLVKKISRAKELNQQMQKLARRAKKAKGKLNEEVDYEILQLREKLYQSQVALLNTVAGNSEATLILNQALEDIMSGFALESRAPPPPPKSNKVTLEITDFPTSASPSSTSSPPY